MAKAKAKGPPRFFLMGLACFHILFASGEAYGWTPLRPLLIDAGYFDRSNPHLRNSRLNLVATLGIAANALCKLPLGVVLDKCGPRTTALLGAVMTTAGSLLMAWGDHQSLVFVGGGYFLLGMGGPFVQMPCFQFTNLFPESKSSAMSFLITCFELSTGVFYLFNISNHKFGWSLKWLFTGYAGVGLFVAVTAAVLWPDKPSMPPLPEPQEDEETEEGLMPPPPPPPPPAPSKPALKDMGLWRQMRSWPFVYVSMYLTLHIFRQGFVLTTIPLQTAHFFPKGDTAGHLSDAFSVILPLGFAPMLLCTLTGFSGWLLNRPQLAFFVVTLFSMAYGALFLVPAYSPLAHLGVPAYLALFAAFPLARQFVFSSFFNYSASTFGFASFGRISGFISTFAGLVQLAQNMLVEYATQEGGRNWEAVDLALAAAPVVLLVPPLYKMLRKHCCAKPMEEIDEGHYSPARPARSFEPEEQAGSSAPLDTPAMLKDPLMERLTGPGRLQRKDPEGISIAQSLAAGAGSPVYINLPRHGSSFNDVSMPRSLRAHSAAAASPLNVPNLGAVSYGFAEVLSNASPSERGSLVGSFTQEGGMSRVASSSFIRTPVGSISRFSSRTSLCDEYEEE